MDSILLFDIDGTLLNTGGAGQRAMEMALGAAFGIESLNEDIPAAGRTDFAITTDLFLRHRIADDAETRSRFAAIYFEHLHITLQSLTGRVLPGVEKLLDAPASSLMCEWGCLPGTMNKEPD